MQRFQSFNCLDENFPYRLFLEESACLLMITYSQKDIPKVSKFHHYTTRYNQRFTKEKKMAHQKMLLYRQLRFYALLMPIFELHSKRFLFHVLRDLSSLPSSKHIPDCLRSFSLCRHSYMNHPLVILVFIVT